MFAKKILAVRRNPEEPGFNSTSSQQVKSRQKLSTELETQGIDGHTIIKVPNMLKFICFTYKNNHGQFSKLAEERKKGR